MSGPVDTWDDDADRSGSWEGVTPARDSRIAHVLLVEDNAHDADLVKLFLGQDERVTWVVTHVETLKEAKQLLSNSEFQVLVVDPGLPDSHGVGSVLSLRAKAPQVPALILSGWEGYENEEGFCPKSEIPQGRLTESLHRLLYGVSHDDITGRIMRSSLSEALRDG